MLNYEFIHINAFVMTSKSIDCFLNLVFTVNQERRKNEMEKAFLL